MSTHGEAATGRWLRAAATAAAAAALVAAPLMTATGASAESHVDNPYAGAVQYVNPTWSAAVTAAAGRQSDATLKDQMAIVAQQPTAVWMDRISAIEGNADGQGLKFHLDGAAAQQKAAGVPVVLNLVIYDLPGRDCFELPSDGDLPATDASLARYKTDFIDPIAALLADPKYANLRIAATIEPHSLATRHRERRRARVRDGDAVLQVGCHVRTGQAARHPERLQLPRHQPRPAGSAGTPTPASLRPPVAQVAKSTTAGLASVDGFVKVTSPTPFPLEEPFLTDPLTTINGAPIRSSTFYEWNADFDAVDFTAHMHRLLVAAGFPSTVGMLVDTSRNGWGGPDRPGAWSTSTDLTTYVDESRVDRRSHRGAWCNPLGAGIGELPKASPSGYPASHLDPCLVGSSTRVSPTVRRPTSPTTRASGFNRMCDPTYVSPRLGNRLTGATPNAPLAGEWFEEQFVTLVKNAYPVIGDDTAPPSVPTGLRAGGSTTSSIGLSWNASTDAGGSGVAGYEILLLDGAVGLDDVGSTVIGTSATTSFTATGLAAGTVYRFAVRAVDNAGNRSASSAAVWGTTQRAPDPPSVPTGLAVGTVTTSSVALSWNASTDSVGVAGYKVYRGSTLIATVTGTRYTVTGLAAGTTYSFGVRAMDVAGNLSNPSPAVSATTRLNPVTGSCSVTYSPYSWSTGFTTSVKVTNTGTTALSSWNLEFELANGQSVTQGWSAIWSQSGSTVTATNAPWNGSISAGGSTDIGFNGTHTGTNTAPTSFTLNGATCTVA